MASSSQLVTRKTPKNTVNTVEGKKMFKTNGIIYIEADQTAKADRGKPRLSLVPSDAVIGIARIREYGCNKYPEGGEDNWKQVEPRRYIDALLRHALAFKDDPCGVDEESGLPHLWHIGCNYAFLSELYGEVFKEYK